MPRSPICAIRACNKHRHGNSRLCIKHAHRQARHGHPEMDRITEKSYRRHRSFIIAGLLRYSQSKPVRAAYAIADEFLNYTPSHGWRWQIQLAQRMAAARSVKCDAFEILRRVAEFYAVVETEPYIFKSPKAEKYALARHVLRTGPSWGKWRPTSVMLNNFGQELAESLGTFALMFLKRLHKDVAERQRLRRAAADFDAIERERVEEDTL